VDRGIVHEHVEPAEPLADDLRQRGRVGGVCDVEPVRDCLPAATGKRLGGGLGFAPVAGGEDDGVARGG